MEVIPVNCSPFYSWTQASFFFRLYQNIIHVRWANKLNGSLCQCTWHICLQFLHVAFDLGLLSFFWFVNLNMIIVCGILTSESTKYNSLFQVFQEISREKLQKFGRAREELFVWVIQLVTHFDLSDTTSCAWRCQTGGGVSYRFVLLERLA